MSVENPPTPLQSLSKSLKNLTLMYLLYSDSTETGEITTPTMSLLLFSE